MQDVTAREAVDAERGRTARGNRTRQALLDSTIAVIGSRGYGGTTTQAVLDRAGLSRGSLLHQFRTRDALMLAAMDEAVQQMLEAADDGLADIVDPIEMLRAFPGVLWAIQKQAPARAYVEILLAARWDDGLRNGLRGALEAWNRQITDRTRDFARANGIGNADELVTEMNVLASAMQSLALTRSLLDDEQGIQDVLDALTSRYLEAVERAVPG